MDARMTVVEGDITELEVDAIVNAANESLLGGGGVDGAIHRAAGPELLEECRTLNGCPTGEAKISKGYDLPAKHVIHTVGPVWNGGMQGEGALLASCYARSLEIAVQFNLRRIAFPGISTGVFRFPPELAARIATATVDAFLSGNQTLAEVIFCCFNAEAAAYYEALLGIEDDWD